MTPRMDLDWTERHVVKGVTEALSKLALDHHTIACKCLICVLWCIADELNGGDLRDATLLAYAKDVTDPKPIERRGKSG